MYINEKSEAERLAFKDSPIFFCYRHWKSTLWQIVREQLPVYTSENRKITRVCFQWRPCIFSDIKQWRTQYNGRNLFRRTFLSTSNLPSVVFCSSHFNLYVEYGAFSIRPFAFEWRHTNYFHVCILILLCRKKVGYKFYFLRTSLRIIFRGYFVR